MDGLFKAINQLITLNAVITHDPDEFDASYATLTSKYETLRAEHEQTQQRINALKNICAPDSPAPRIKSRR